MIKSSHTKHINYNHHPCLVNVITSVFIQCETETWFFVPTCLMCQRVPQSGREVSMGLHECYIANAFFKLTQLFLSFSLSSSDVQCAFKFSTECLFLFVCLFSRDNDIMPVENVKKWVNWSNFVHVRAVNRRHGKIPSCVHARTCKV